MATAGGSCLNDSNCPSHKPYCTPVGCVFECPQESFIDGLVCVEDCEERVILNRSCVSTCPASYPFTVEKIDVRGIRFVKLKFCSQSCPENTYQYNGLCEQACPAEAPFSFNGGCLDRCPDSHMFERNITINGRLVSKECLVNCSGLFPLRSGLSSNTCVAECQEGQKIYNDSFCVRDCPANAPFETSYGVYNYYGSKSAVRCVPDCEDLFYRNVTCVDFCPEYTLENKTCIDSCPDTAPFNCDQKLDTSCTVNNKPLVSRRRINLKVCLEKCPIDSYIDRISCVDTCPDNKYHHNKSMSCFEMCPESAPLMYDKHLLGWWQQLHSLYPNKLCLEVCPEDTYDFNHTCLSYCPSGFKYYKNVCVENCPLECPYHTPENCWSYGRLYSRHYHRSNCTDKCPGDLFIDGHTCVCHCPNNKFAFELNMSCLHKCPDTHPLLRITELQTLCQNECISGTFYSEGKCVETCSGNPIFNYSCVSACPSSHPLLRDENCVNDCTTEYRHQSKCVVTCPSNTMIFSGSCVDECPHSHPLMETSYSGTKSCVEECSYSRVSYNGQCISESDCKAEIITVDGKCIDSCPDGYIWISTDTRRGDRKPGFPVCHSKAAITILFVLTLVLSFNSAMMYWRCFFPTFEVFTDRLFRRDHHKLVSHVQHWN